MQTHPVHGLIFSLPPGSPELLVPSTIIHVIDLNFKSQLHFQFQQKIKITQRKNLAIINSAAMNIGVLVSLSLLVFSVCMPSSGIAAGFSISKEPPGAAGPSLPWFPRTGFLELAGCAGIMGTQSWVPRHWLCDRRNPHTESFPIPHIH